MRATHKKHENNAKTDMLMYVSLFLLFSYLTRLSLKFTCCLNTVCILPSDEIPLEKSIQITQHRQK